MASCEFDEDLVIVEEVRDEEVDLWENERYFPFIGWSNNMYPTDRANFSDFSGGKTLCKESYVLPPMWAWIDTNWHIDMTGNVDEHGWYYATDFSTSSWHPRNQSMDTARRRRWTRKRGLRISSTRPRYVEWFQEVSEPHNSAAERLSQRWMTACGAREKMKLSPVTYLQYVAQADIMLSHRLIRTARNLALKQRSNSPALPDSIASMAASVLHFDEQLLDDLDQIERDIGRTEATGFTIPSLRSLLLQEELPDDFTPGGDGVNSTISSSVLASSSSDMNIPVLLSRLCSDQPGNEPTPIPVLILSPAQRLRRVLTAYACRNIGVGYVQGLNFVVRLLLALTTEENTFWMLAAIVEDMRLPDFYSRMPVGMAGLRVSMHVLKAMLFNAAKAHPRSGIERLLSNLGRDELDALVDTVAPKLLIPLAINSLPLDTTLLVLDRFFVRQLAPRVEHRLDTPLFEILLLILNGAADLIIDDTECRTHTLLTYMTSLSAIQLWSMLTTSKQQYPDPHTFHTYLVQARNDILQEWLFSDAYLRGDTPNAFSPEQLEDIRSVYHQLCLHNQRQQRRKGHTKLKKGAILSTNTLLPDTTSCTSVASVTHPAQRNFHCVPSLSSSPMIGSTSAQVVSQHIPPSRMDPNHLMLPGPVVSSLISTNGEPSASLAVMVSEMGADFMQATSVTGAIGTIAHHTDKIVTQKKMELSVKHDEIMVLIQQEQLRQQQEQLQHQPAKAAGSAVVASADTHSNSFGHVGYFDTIRSAVGVVIASVSRSSSPVTSPQLKSVTTGPSSRLEPLILDRRPRSACSASVGIHSTNAASINTTHINILPVEHAATSTALSTLASNTDDCVPGAAAASASIEAGATCPVPGVAGGDGSSSGDGDGDLVVAEYSANGICVSQLADIFLASRLVHCMADDNTEFVATQTSSASSSQIIQTQTANVSEVTFADDDSLEVHSVLASVADQLPPGIYTSSDVSILSVLHQTVTLPTAMGVEMYRTRLALLAERLFLLSDSDCDGELDLREFLSMVTVLRGCSGRQQLIRLIFQLMDANGSGFIALDEAMVLADVFSAIHQSAQAPVSRTSDRAISPAPYTCVATSSVCGSKSRLTATSSEHWLEYMFASFDHDKDGLISFHEFLQGMLSVTTHIPEAFVMSSVKLTAVEEESFENQRYIVLLGWSQNNLFPSDRPIWSSEDGKDNRALETVGLDDGALWTWMDAWKIDYTFGDGEGWMYAVDFSLPANQWQRTQFKVGICRRRRYLRHRHCAADLLEPRVPPAIGGGVASFAGGRQHAKEQYHAQQRQHAQIQEKQMVITQAVKLGF